MVYICSFYRYGLYGYGSYFDPTYILVIIGFLLSILATGYVNSTMAKYRKIHSSTGLSGAEAAERILARNGIYSVHVECLGSSGGDHYDPRTCTVRLSNEVYNGRSITAIAVAAHECGHAIQHEENYLPMAVRSALVPVVNFASTISMPLILLGVVLSWNPLLIQIGIWAFAAAVLFQVVTLPVEFNASFRAVRVIAENGLLTEHENRGCKKVLRAAAFTYVAGAAATALQLVRLILLFGGGKRRD